MDEVRVPVPFSSAFQRGLVVLVSKAYPILLGFSLFSSICI